MPLQLMRLRGVPEDELEELAALLDANDIDYYETSAGNWGISMPALWVHDQAEYERARALIDNYQAERYRKARREYETRRAQGQARTFVDMLMEAPLKVLFYLALVLALISLSTLPFLRPGGA